MIAGGTNRGRSDINPTECGSNAALRMPAFESHDPVKESVLQLAKMCWKHSYNIIIL